MKIWLSNTGFLMYRKSFTAYTTAIHLSPQKNLQIQDPGFDVADSPLLQSPYLPLCVVQVFTITCSPKPFRLKKMCMDSMSMTSILGVLTASPVQL